MNINPMRLVNIVLILLTLCLTACSSKEEPLPPSWAFNTSFVEHSPAIGNPNAPVKIEVFSDFACQHCKKGAKLTKELMLEYPEQLFVVFKHMPARSKGKGMNAAKAARAASVQDRFWDMHDALFEFGRKLTKKEVYDIASLLGLEMFLFNEDYNDPIQEKYITTDIGLGKSLGVNGTPTYFINGTPVKGTQPDSVFHAAIESEIRKPAALRR